MKRASLTYANPPANTVLNGAIVVLAHARYVRAVDNEALIQVSESHISVNEKTKLIIRMVGSRMSTTESYRRPLQGEGWS
jgi:hypothetical protein